jgi:hypothetical protein
VRLGLNPEINALATIVLSVVATATFVAAMLQSRRQVA